MSAAWANGRPCYNEAARAPLGERRQSGLGIGRLCGWRIQDGPLRSGMVVMWSALVAGRCGLARGQLGRGIPHPRGLAAPWTAKLS
jgi:hypothetical protein